MTMTVLERMSWERSSTDFRIPVEYRPHGIHIVGGRETGKSWFMGRALAYHDLVSEVPTVIIDPVGKVINYLLDKVGTRPRKMQERLWPRIRYVDMVGRDGYVIPYPLYYRLDDETRFTISSRFIEIIGRMNPQLEDAPVNGMNAIREVGRPTGILLSSLGFQITEAESLLTDTRSWEVRLKKVTQPRDVADAARYFLKDYSRQHATAFRNKISDITLDPVNRAIFGASSWAIPWQEVIDKKLCVLIDIHREQNRDMKALKMLWLFHSLVNFIISQGVSRTIPISIIIDELAAMYRIGDKVLAEQIDDLTSVYGRNFQIWLTLAHQELYQFDEPTQKSLMSMGTQMIGATTDPQSAWKYAQQFVRVDPKLEKRKRQSLIHTNSVQMEMVEVDSVEYTPQEQLITGSYLFMDSLPLYFYATIGGGNTKLIRLTEPPAKVNIEMVERDKGLLMRKYGRRIDDVEHEIENRLSTQAVADYEAPTYDIPEIGDDEDEYLAPPRS